MHDFTSPVRLSAYPAAGVRSGFGERLPAGVHHVDHLLHDVVAREALLGEAPDKGWLRSAHSALACYAIEDEEMLRGLDELGRLLQTMR